MSDINYLLYFENVRTKNRTLPARVGKKNFFFFGSQKKKKKKKIGSQEKFGSVGKQQTNNFLILALVRENRSSGFSTSCDKLPCTVQEKGYKFEMLDLLIRKIYNLCSENNGADL